MIIATCLNILENISSKRKHSGRTLYRAWKPENHGVEERALYHIYPKRLEIWNSGTLPDGITNESLRKGQISVLRNPDIAHVLYLRGFMEKAGRGSVLIIEACRRQELPEPKWTSEQSRGVTLTFFAAQVTPEVERLLKHLKGEMSRQELQEAMGLKSSKHFRKAYLLPALEMGVIEMTIPEKPRSGNQKYRRTIEIAK